MRDSIIVLIGMLFLSGGPKPDTPASKPETPVTTRGEELGICLSRMEDLEARLDRLEMSSPRQMKASLDGRTEIFKTPEGCMM